jgi:hypothetical protein
VCCFTCLPGFGFWEITRPFFTVEDAAFLTLPTEQNAFLIAFLAAFRVLPLSFGTMHGRSTKVAATVVLPSVVIVQPPVPVQAPVQPVKREPLVAFAVRVTDVP